MSWWLNVKDERNISVAGQRDDDDPLTGLQK